MTANADRIEELGRAIGHWRRAREDQAHFDRYQGMNAVVMNYNVTARTPEWDAIKALVDQRARRAVQQAEKRVIECAYDVVETEKETTT